LFLWVPEADLLEEVLSEVRFQKNIKRSEQNRKKEDRMKQIKRLD
jgi:hypothetical protein